MLHLLWLCVDALHPVGAILYKVEKELIMLDRNAQQSKQIRIFPKLAHNKDKMSTDEVKVNFSLNPQIHCVFLLYRSRESLINGYFKSP